MAVLSPNALTLNDWAKRVDPTGKIGGIVELLEQTNEILLDMRFIEGNLPTGNRTTVRTGLPTVAWRMLNQGVPSSKSATAQIDEQAGMLEAWSEVDVDLALLNGDVAAFRLSEARAFLEAMNQEAAGTVFYGNGGISAEEFTGLAPRYSSLAAGNRQNIVNGLGAGATNTSIYLIVWGENTCAGIFPKGSKAGIDHQDYGAVTVEVSTGVGGNRLRAFQERWQWKLGLMLKDWRFVVRICNIDIPALIANAGAQAKLLQLMAKATHRIPSLNLGKAAFYCNRTVAEYLDIQQTEALGAGGGLSVDTVQGRRVVSYRGIPIRTCDALLETEAAVV